MFRRSRIWRNVPITNALIGHGNVSRDTMETDSKLCKPSGELTIFEAASFKESLIRLMSNDGLVCMDLGKVTRVDTAAIQLMWAARKVGRLLVTGIPQELQTKLTQLGFSESLSE